MHRSPLRILVTLSLGLCACHLVAGLEERRLAQAPASSTQTEGGSDGTCGRSVPPPPAADDTGTPLLSLGIDTPNALGKPQERNEDGTLEFDLLFAVDQVNLDLDPRRPVSGLDLDRTCSCTQHSESCVPARGSAGHCDGADGADNSFLQILRDYSALGELSGLTRLNPDLKAGKYTLFVRIRRYNGLANDTQIEGSLYSSSNAETRPPRLDGKDVWSVDRESVLAGKPDDEGDLRPVNFSNRGYVRDGVVVIPVDFPFQLGSIAGTSQRLTIRLSGGYVVGKLTRTAEGALRLSDGVLAGRWPTDEALTSLQNVRDPFGPSGEGAQYLCRDNLLYQQIKPRICAAADIAGSATQDNTGAACSALSVGLPFEAVQARFGDILQKPADEAPCGNDWRDSCPP